PPGTRKRIPPSAQAGSPASGSGGVSWRAETVPVREYPSLTFAGEGGSRQTPAPAQPPSHAVLRAATGSRSRLLRQRDHRRRTSASRPPAVHGPLESLATA